jgi:hypothetical protein
MGGNNAEGLHLDPIGPSWRCLRFIARHTLQQHQIVPMDQLLLIHITEHGFDPAARLAHDPGRLLGVVIDQPPRHLATRLIQADHSLAAGKVALHTAYANRQQAAALLS